ncbi:Phosphatidylinositol transfer protein SFH5 [Pestalotiopsis fici W106-1]|uniref:Phosphatidylinositol transfer protein SFH5 n=1 Tax=Pestalotiopsis fici (strain W106-1 / CGMCC3.15140) TaxID=1229662 RepID=W3WRZ6_PESFW|nr:Phosphatidylinositol transfer protein SFH5 [Pestalotiopsis fici W106-1]ETS76630.1 Phosphatidylinositol transfer protein SFH5 [Pestalotiopsis fici W106-1]
MADVVAPAASDAKVVEPTVESPEKAAAPAAESTETTAPSDTTKVAEPEKSAETAEKGAEPVAAPTETLEKPAEPVAAGAPATTEKATEEKPEASAAQETTATPLQQLWATAKTNGHPEIWGVTLADPDTHVPSQIVFQKFLNANDGDLTKAKDQLTKTLEWRAKSKPLDSLTKKFSKEKFEGLGYVTSYGGETPETKEVFTWNIYGIVKSMEATFGNVDEFIAWRAALMELALQELSLSTATKPITATEDPYKIFQVHDYLSISFFRQNPAVKAASKETIRIFALTYPELLKEKFFVNVPAIMGFIYGAMKLFVAPKTIKKFHPMSNGGALALEFPDSKVENLGEKLPKAYGGKGEDLQAQGKATQLE